MGKTGSYRVPDSVAFSNCSSLTSVTIPNSVISIGIDAFYNCSSLTRAYFQGSPPSFSDLFAYAATIVYYLPGTTGWGTTFGDRRTALWLPQVQTNDATFGVQTNHFGFTINWATDKVVVVEASMDLTNPTWSPVGTNTLVGGTSYFVDPQSTQYPNRFYRLRSP